MPKQDSAGSNSRLPFWLKSGAIEPKEKPPRTAEMVVEVVEQNMVLASTTLEKYLIPDSSLPNLQSRGIIVNPLVQDDEQQVPYNEGPLVFPITRMTKREQQLYMSALRTLCKALNISPFGRMEDILARVHSAADDAGLQIFVAREYWFPSLSFPTNNFSGNSLRFIKWCNISTLTL